MVHIVGGDLLHKKKIKINPENKWSRIVVFKYLEADYLS